MIELIYLAALGVWVALGFHALIGGSRRAFALWAAFSYLVILGVALAEVAR